MRKIFSFLMMALFSVSMFAGEIGVEPVTVKSTFTKATVPADNRVTDLEGVVTWDIATTVGNGSPTYAVGKSNSVECIKFGTSGSVYFSKIDLSTDYFKNYNVIEVKLYVLNNGKKTGTLTATQGTVTIGSESKEFGTAWTVLTANTNKGKGGTLTVTYEVAQASYWSYIEVTYEEGDAPACTKTVTITKGDEINGTFKLSATEVCGDGEGEDVLVTNIAPAEGYEFGEITTSVSGVVDNENKKVTGIKENTTISVVFNEIPKYTVSFSTGEGNPEQAPIAETIGGAGIELPEGPTPKCEDWTFAGWAEAAVAAETTEAPELHIAGKNFKPAENVTLFAVYKRVEEGGVADLDVTETFEKQTAGTKYNDTLSYKEAESVAELAWTMYYGTVSTNDAVSSGNNAQMRWYASATDKLGCIVTNTPVPGLKSIDFKARVSSTDVKMSVWYSTDGEDWTVAKENLTFEKTGSGLNFSAEINGEEGVGYYIKIGVGDGGTAPSSNNYKLGIDDVKFNYRGAGKTTYYLSAPSCAAPEPEKVSIFFVNVQGWEEVRVHLWGGSAAGTEWPGVEMTKLGEEEKINGFDVYQFEAAEGAYAKCVFNDNGSDEKKTADLDWTSGKYFYENAWYAKEEIPAPVVPAKFYVTGNAALVGTELEWHPDAIKVTEDSYTFENLAAGDYKLKVTIDGDWGTEKGFTDLAKPVAAGLGGDKDNNICFSLAEAGDVTVTCTEELFKVEGNFFVEVPAKYYITGDSAFIVDAGSEAAYWAPTAIKSETEEYVIKNLKGGVPYMMQLTLDGDWGTVKGYDQLTEVPAGVTRGESDEFKDDDNNICFTLAEDGDLTITYKVVDEVEIFTIEGNFFYEIPAKFFIAGDSALIIDAGLTIDKKWAPDAIKSEADSYKLNLKAGVDYKLKITVDGTWSTGKGFSDLTTKENGLSADGDNNICFRLNADGEVNVHYDGTYFFLNGDFYVAPEPEKQYFLKNNWRGEEEWSWIELVKNTESGYYESEIVVFGGKGVDFNTAESDEGKTWIDAADIEAFDMKAMELTTLGALDTVAFVFDPEAVNAFTGANGLSAYVVGKYVEPTPEPVAKFYVTGNAALVGTELEWHPDAIKVTEDSYTFENLAAGDYKLKVTVDGDWGTTKSFDNLTLKSEGLSTDGDNNICFTLAEAGNVVVTYTDEIFTVEGNFYVAPEPKLADGYYLVGKFSGVDKWSVADLDEKKLFVANESTEGEYKLTFKVAAGDEFKVVAIENDALVAWFPEEGDNYVVSAALAGNIDIYFRPDYKGGEGWHAGCIYAMKHVPGTAINNTNADAKAVKVVRNGQIFIIKGDKTYNVLGTLVK